MPARPTNIRWLLIVLLFVLSAVAFLDRVNMSVAGPRIIAAYHLTDVQFGLLSTAFLLGYAFLQTPAGWLSDRWGPRRVLAIGVVWWGAFTAITAMVTVAIGGAFALLLLARLSLGAGEAVMYPGSSQFVSRWIPTQERGLANGLIFAGVGVGSAASPPLVTYIILNYGWHASFYMCAFIGLAVGAIWFAASRDKPEQHPLVSPSELATINSGLTLGSPGIAAGSKPSVPWRAIFSNASVWAIAVSYFCYGYVAWIFFGWFFIYLARVRAMNLKSSAFYASLPFIAMAVGCAVGGLIADALTKRISRRAGRCGIAVVGTALTALFIAFGSTVNSAPLAAVMLAGGAGSLYLSQSSYWAISTDIGGRFSGSVSGFVNMACQLGGALTTFLTPLIALHFGWTASFLVAAALSVVASLSWLAVNPDRPLIPVSPAVPANSPVSS
jgi:ACS family glucarate transporter-like MFS transporter